jgi:two-component system LytT family sensor kinase
MSTTSKTTIYWTVQILGWSLFYLLVLGVNLVAKMVIITPSFYVYAIEGVLFSILTTHLIRFILIRSDWLKLPILAIMWRSILITILSAILFEVIENLSSLLIAKDYYTDLNLNHFSTSKVFGSIIGNTILFCIWLSFYYAYQFIEKSRKQEITNLQFTASKNEIELKNLREQINPHFLFNSLNSIKALVEIDKDEAKVAITKLSNLLRKSIQLGRHKLITIMEELDIVESYIDLEKIRFEERINATITVSDNSYKCLIPPLMIQTLAENAIKHGLSKSIEGGILNITIDRIENTLNISIQNTGNLNKIGESEGVGIYNTKKRLGILFGKKAKFKIFQKDHLVCVEIQIVCNNL